MRLNVEHIDDRGEPITAGMGDVWAVQAAADALEGKPTHVAVDWSVRRAHGHVFVTGTAEASAPRTCERCGETTSLNVQTDVDLSYVPEARHGVEVPENELKADELDVGWYAGGHLDLSDTLREALALALPPRVVCEDVAACDARTHALLAGGSEIAGHPGFAALRNWSKH